MAMPRSGPWRKWRRPLCCRNSTAQISRWCTPTGTSSCSRADATSNAPTMRMRKVTATTITTAIITMLEYDFMRNAFAAAGVAAVVSGLVGYFLVLRGQTFAGHALSHIGFAGATGAVLIGVASVWGLVGFTVAAGI